MGKTLLGLCLMAIFVGTALANSPARHFLLSNGDNPLWGNDVVISNSEPVGRPSAAGRPNGMVYVAVPDTLGSQFAVKVYRSTDFGDSWSMVSAVPTSPNSFEKVKVIRTAADSIYCLAQTGTSIYCWNVETPFPILFTGEAVRDFDVASSSQGNELYIFTDILATNQIRRYSSIDGGLTWGGNSLVTSAGAHPRVYMSTGDTLTLNYYGPVLADTATSVVRMARYRRSGDGTLASVNFIDIITGTERKEQFGSVIHGGVIWFFYTAGDSGSRDLKCRVSTDNGVTYGAIVNIAAVQTIDEFWFDAQHWSDGVDVIYTADTTTGTRMYHMFADVATPLGFSLPEWFSEHAPVTSPRGYIPSLAEFHDVTDDAGAIWVGMNGSSARLYWDRFGAPPTGVTIEDEGLPNDFRLDQNYPNPFNPSTAIRFTLPATSTVGLTVYDLLGRKVAELAHGEYGGGTYTAEWDGMNLSGSPAASGLYFYRLEATSTGGNASFFDVKKMVLLK